MTTDGTARGVLNAGVDIGGTKTAVVITDEHDRLVYHAQQPTDRNRLAEKITEALRVAVGESEKVGKVAAIGIAAPGQVDSASGSVHLAVNLGSHDVDLRGPVMHALGRPCVVEHDTRAAAIWLYHTAAREGRPPAGLAYLAVGTGVSAGIVMDGRVVRGAKGLAGEVGHTVADPDGPQCACGLRGCLEALTSGPSIARRAGAPSAEAVFARADAGDSDAADSVAEAAAHLARAVRSLVLAFGVDQVVVGGGVAGAGESLRRPLMAAIDDERRRSALVERAFAGTTVSLLPPETAAGARGAALVARLAVAGHAAATGGKGVSRE